MSNQFYDEDLAYHIWETEGFAERMPFDEFILALDAMFSEQKEQRDDINRLIPFIDLNAVRDYLEEAKKFLNLAHNDDNDTSRLLNIMYAEDFIECALCELEED